MQKTATENAIFREPDSVRALPTQCAGGDRRGPCHDEVQRGGPELVLAIKSVVDRDLSAGQFLLTGSANLLRNPRVLDALTGPAETLHLLGANEERLLGDEQVTGMAIEVKSKARWRRSLSKLRDAGAEPCNSIV